MPARWTVRVVSRQVVVCGVAEGTMCVCGWLHDGLLLGGWELRCLSFGEWRPGCVDIVVASAAVFDGDNKHPAPELLPVHAFVRCSDDFHGVVGCLQT